MEHNIKDILGQIEEQPSPSCWNRLSSRLDAAMPQQVQQPMSGNTSAAAHKLHSLGAAWKAVAAVAGAVAVSAATVTLFLLNKDNTPSPQSTKSGNTAVQTDSLAEEQGDTVNVVATTPAKTNEVQNATTVPKYEFPATPHHSAQDQAGTDPIRKDNRETMSAAVTPIATVPALSPVSPAPSSPIQPILLPTGATDTPVPATHEFDTTTPTETQHAASETFPLQIPNVFTPNGDGYNDYFEIKGLEHCTNCQVTIRSQSGNIVFKSGDYHNNWGGDDCLDGVYHYQITYKMAGEEAHTVTGLVHILRR